jgi:hypothetical protein
MQARLHLFFVLYGYTASAKEVFYGEAGQEEGSGAEANDGNGTVVVAGFIYDQLPVVAAEQVRDD